MYFYRVAQSARRLNPEGPCVASAQLADHTCNKRVGMLMNYKLHEGWRSDREQGCK